MNKIYDRPAEQNAPQDIKFFANRLAGSGIPGAGMGIIENYGDDQGRDNNMPPFVQRQQSHQQSPQMPQTSQMPQSPQMPEFSGMHGNNQNNQFDASGDSSENQQESFIDKLHDNLGFFVVCEFLAGSLTTRQGILNEVGPDYIVLYDDLQGYYTLCDLDSLKFATFYNSKVTPRVFRMRR